MTAAKKKQEAEEKGKKEKRATETVGVEETSDAPWEIPVGEDASDDGAESSDAAEEVDEVEALQMQVADLEGKKLRAMADLDNYRKQMTRRFQDVIQTSNDRLLAELLEVIDNFERALAHGVTENSVEANSDSIREGTELIYNQMRDFLGRYQVKPIEAVGHPFDPNLHEAMMQVASDEYDEGIVVTEISKGYTVGERVLRHARVAVSNGKPTEKEEEKEQEEQADES